MARASGYYGGLAAEDIAAGAYGRDGGTITATRWRAPEGEIDLIVTFPDLTVFVEVKARRDHATAAASISPRQWSRIAAAATRWLAQNPDGPQNCRFDAALIDGTGRLERVENAASFDDW